MNTRSAELGATLRSWRDRLPSSAAGLPSGRARRAAGLRREELADLAGVSVDYVVSLEQGRATSPSAQVVAALSRALQLSTAEPDHLYLLAGLAAPSDGEVSDHITPGVQRVLARLADAAVAVFAADWQLIWWTVTSLAPDSVEAAVVSDLRRATGRFPNSRRLADLIHTLTTGNARFAELWATGAVGAHREDHKIVEHPSVGPIEVDCDVLTDGTAELKIVILTAAAGGEDETKLRLAVLSGVPVPSGAPMS